MGRKSLGKSKKHSNTPAQARKMDTNSLQIELNNDFLYPLLLNTIIEHNLVPSSHLIRFRNLIYSGNQKILEYSQFTLLIVYCHYNP